MAKRDKKEPFEKALQRLETIAARLEEGQLPLEEALKQYEEGVKAYRHCSALLEQVRRKIEVLTKDEGGAIRTEVIDSLADS